MRGLSLLAASGGHSSSRCAGLSLSWPLLLQSTGSRFAGSVVVAHGPSCSTACGIFLDQGSNPCPLHWQADSQPLRHRGSPSLHFNTQMILMHTELKELTFHMIINALCKANSRTVNDGFSWKGVGREILSLRGCSLGDLPWEAVGRQGAAWEHPSRLLGKVPKEEFLGKPWDRDLRVSGLIGSWFQGALVGEWGHGTAKGKKPAQGHEWAGWLWAPLGVACCTPTWRARKLKSDSFNSHSPLAGSFCQED